MHFKDPNRFVYITPDETFSFFAFFTTMCNDCLEKNSNTDIDHCKSLLTVIVASVAKEFHLLSGFYLTSEEYFPGGEETKYTVGFV